MTLSTESLLSCKIILPEEMPANIDQHILARLDNLKKLTGASVESIIDEIKAEAAKTPNYLYSEKYGLICCAGTKSEVDSLYMNGLKILNGEQKEPFSVKKTSGRISNKIAIITGAAQGFGKGIAKDLFEEGANIIIADLNEEAGIALRNELNETDTPNRAFFVKMDVSNPESVENTIFETVREYGGLDIMISNAGVLRAGGLDEMNASTFKFMTDINYTGYFFCAKYASAVMKIQNNYNQEYFYDILQINSKSGLSGSKKNFAYAGGKFGGIGLTQSFALELI
ncbi:MAG: SDR family NAD(P)-dependent oxidoreductase, partial [Bacteroidales bacterium]|nr:SDR family NAD(P)-dependent oxidoreductase [Bacteroidales bacterium]